MTNRCEYAEDENDYYRRNDSVNCEIELSSNGENTIICIPSDLNKAIRNRLQETIDIATRLVEGDNLNRDSIHHVIAVGGSSHLYLVKTLLKMRFSRAHFHAVNPEQAVASGCMKFIIDKYINKRFSIEEQIAISYGLQSGEKEVVLFLEKGEKIPVSKKVEFTNLRDNETEYHSTIYQWAGELSEAKWINGKYIVPKDKCTAINSLKFHNPYPQPKEKQKLKIKFKLDFGGTLTVKCKDRDRKEVLTQECFPAVYGSAYFVCFEHILTIAGIFHFDV